MRRAEKGPHASCLMPSGRNMTKPLRVLQVVGNSVIGGAENHVLTLARSLAAQPDQYRVAVICPRPGPLVEILQQDKIEVRLIEHVQAAPDDEYEPTLPALWGFYQAIRRWRADVVHSHLYPAHVHATLAGELAGVPALLTTAHSLVVRPADPWLIGMTRGRIIACSQAVKTVLTQGGVPANRIKVIYNGIEQRYFQDEFGRACQIRQELGLPADVPVVGIIARLSPEKGHRAFLQIAQRVAARWSETRFLIVGTGPIADELQAFVCELGLADRVVFTGARRDVTALNHVIDIFALPSREEALPLAVLEAMAARRPIVASAVGGVPEVVVDGETGFLYALADLDGFVEGISRLIAQPELRAAFGRAAEQRVRRRFGVDLMMRETTRYYRATLAAARPSP